MDHTLQLFDAIEGIDFLARPKRRALRRTVKAKMSARRNERGRKGERQFEGAIRRREPQRQFKFKRWLDERKNRFSTRVIGERERNEFVWMAEDVRKLHLGLLDTSLRQLETTPIGTALFKELAAWFDDPNAAPAPFSLAACCAVARIDVDDQREKAMAIVLANAVKSARKSSKRGNAALDWMRRGYTDEPMSFQRCCEAVGYSPRQIIGRLAA